jgi:hypothetical protein
MTDNARSKVILQTYRAESAWDSMVEFMNMSDVERALLSVQLHMVDAIRSDTDSEERRIELEHAWHELDQVMYDLAKERKAAHGD